VKRLARGLERARERRSRIGKEEAIADALSAIAAEGDDGALAIAARLASGRILPVGDGRAIGVGGSLLLDVVCGATGFDTDVVVACARAAGELAEAFALLVARLPGAEARPGADLRAVADLASALASEPARARKRVLLDAAFACATPLETKYIAKALGGGMRIGAQEGVVEGAIARAFQVEFDRVRRAAGVITDVGELCVLARRGRLEEARVTVGRPVAFMLATPLETIATPIDPSVFVVEDKIDGVRAQVHRSEDGRVAIFARGLDRTTGAFPEVVEALARAPGIAILDGEVVAVTAEGRPRPFQSLQPRLKKITPSAGDREQARVALVAFDLLADDSGSLVHLPWTERRARLERFVASLGGAPGIVLQSAAALATDVPLAQAIDHVFSAARDRGHEGLVLKRADAPYDAGRRGQAWIKVKRAHATLDVVVVAAQEGHGRRAGALSDYTFAVWRGEELVTVGKAYSGLTDDEIDAMTRRFEATTVERHGAIRLVRAEVVLEVAFDGVQRSSRHASGFALRFPRIVRIRTDKTAAEADRLDTVEALFAGQVASGHREHEDRPARGRRRPPAARKQLSLFGDDES
jgi:DNA ligase-1